METLGHLAKIQLFFLGYFSLVWQFDSIRRKRVDDVFDGPQPDVAMGVGELGTHVQEKLHRLVALVEGNLRGEPVEGVVSRGQIVFEPKHDIL